MSLTSFFLQVLNGISFGALLFFMGSGLTLIFGLMRIANLAHGAFYLLGGYLGLVTAAATGSYWLGLLVAAVGVGVFGLLCERVLLRQIRGQELPEVLLTIGIALVIADLSLWAFGGDPQTVAPPDFLNGTVEVGSVVYPGYRLFVIAMAILAGLALWFVQSRTRVGAIVRAGVDDRETIAALGINVKLVFSAVFAAGAALAGFAGVIGGSLLSLRPGTEVEILLLSLVVVILGGLGSLAGAAVGSLLVGLLDAFGKALVPELSYFTLFAPMLLILILRPQGLLGKARA